MLFCLGPAHPQETETYLLHQAVSNREIIVYTRVIRFDNQKHLFHVQDYYEDGRISAPSSSRTTITRWSSWPGPSA